MYTRKGFSKSAEGNLLLSCLGLDSRTCILVNDGTFGKQVGLFEVFSVIFRFRENIFGFNFQSLESL